MRLDTFKNFFNRRPKVGDKVKCKKNFKFIKEVTPFDSWYATQTGNQSSKDDLIKGKTYMFEEGKSYEVINVSENSIKIKNNSIQPKFLQTQTFLFKSHISKYETQYFPIFSDYFES
jgi:hypothetical protein